MKRTILLLAALMMLVGSIDASASTCWRCRFRDNTCIINMGTFSFCDDSQGFCDISGDCGVGVATVNETALATQWTVASVERLDEPHTSTTAAKVARVAPKPAPAR
jgi:hypothetical protein